MIRWFTGRDWLPGVYLALAALAIFGPLDYLMQGTTALGASALLAASLIFSKRTPPLTLLLLAAGAGFALWQGLDPLVGGLAIVPAVLVVSAFSEQVWRLAVLFFALLLGVGTVVYQAITRPATEPLYGISMVDQVGRLSVGLLGSCLLGSLLALAWLGGRLLFTRDRHVGTRHDRAVTTGEQARLNLEIAEQNERFDNARDINELIIQRISGVISLTEGGLYAAKVDQQAAVRALEEGNALARKAHAELRRLYDMLNRTHEVSAAPPGIDQLPQLATAYRELGYSVAIRHEGPRFATGDGAGLAIYRIVFDALSNVRDHAPVGADIAIDFTWVEQGLQILVKDNGIEVQNRARVAAGEDVAYTALDDHRALVEPIRGASLTAMAERAALYGGKIEATRVPGVGFTVSAIFPNLGELVP